MYNFTVDPIENGVLLTWYTEIPGSKKDWNRVYCKDYTEAVELIAGVLNVKRTKK